MIIMFLIFMILAFACSVPSTLMSVKVIPAPPGLDPWRALIVGGITFASFFFLAIRYIDWLFTPAPATIWFKLLVRLHFLALIGLALEFWLERRRLRNLPPPKIEFYK